MKFCDMNCPHAAFPEKLADGSKSCMTFSALRCNLLERLVHKSGPCEYFVETGIDPKSIPVDQESSKN